ncbi:MAG TPA: hypothetical protein PLZ70_01980, partial [Candidatus Paceibacterota bacterium]|nr:hypothetical protein [Candidatus Paceibacterota bacterium]
MDLLYHLTGKNLIDLWKKEVITSLLFCTKASLLVTNNSSPSLGIFATPARCFLWSENIAPPHKSEKDWRSPVFLGSRFCAQERTAITLLGLDSKIFRRKFLVWPPARLFFLLEKHDSAVQV